ncbi:DUF4268 domain-containing protein [Acidimicrobiia bacterium EGI L10123]|uniref:DUF4268 domain-containing protein n=1 Tax=Salinilacustrithrix flava TaxID=2957203 RepID=UPI003D7C2EDC|nr:DUF4268 domain-containing protein [Acidimicrobiia bacterium EGI L10123]
MQLGRLEPVDPRAVWQSEARDFTPWLLANGDRLADALGIDLELSGAEHPVGGFSLDLIGHDLTNDAVLMVENQLEATDHTHLGQLLTYAAGTGAATIVWVATSFREEHRQALDWLNEQTGQGTHFFAVQVNVARIGDSDPAPYFDVVAKPNDWQKRIRSATRAGATTERAEQYREFWALYLDALAEADLSWGRRTPQPANWMNFAGPFTGTNLNPSFASGKRLRHELYIDGGDADANGVLFELLVGQRSTLEERFGEALEFDPIEGRRAARIATYQDGCEISDVDDWDNYIAWFIDTGSRLRTAFGTVRVVVEGQLDGLAGLT